MRCGQKRLFFFLKHLQTWFCEATFAHLREQGPGALKTCCHLSDKINSKNAIMSLSNVDNVQPSMHKRRTKTGRMPFIQITLNTGILAWMKVLSCFRWAELVQIWIYQECVDKLGSTKACKGLRQLAWHSNQCRLLPTVQHILHYRTHKSARHRPVFSFNTPQRITKFV